MFFIGCQLESTVYCTWLSRYGASKILGSWP